MTAHPLDEVRERQYDADPDWLSVARMGICEVLRRQQFVHADDLEPLGIPDAHRNVIGSAFAALSLRKWIVAVDRRASKVRRRNCRKSGVYRATSKFPRTATAGVGVDGVPSRQGLVPHSLDTVAVPPVSVHSGGAGVGGRGEPGAKGSAAVKAPGSASSDKIVGVGADGVPSRRSLSLVPHSLDTAAASPVSADPGECSPGIQQDNAVPSRAASVGSSAIPGEPARLFELAPERPRSAITDPRAA